MKTLGLKKIDSLFSLIRHQPDINKIYLYTKDFYEAKYQFLIKKRESTGLKHWNGLKASIKYSNDMDDIYINIEECNPNKKRKILIVFDGMVADMLCNKKLNLVVAELFIKATKLSIPLAFITQSYFAVPKNTDKYKTKLYALFYFENLKQTRAPANCTLIIHLIFII